MHDSQSLVAERRVQPLFSNLVRAAALLPALCVLLFAWQVEQMPDREELGPRIARVEFKPVQLDGAGFAPFRLAGAWTLSSGDPRFGGISALALDRGRLFALTDSGVVVRLPKPTPGAASALIDELPGGPRSAGFKLNRDTESLARDPAGRGWWVGFETWHELWLYDPAFEHALQRIKLGSKRWRRNSGAEALLADGGDLLVVPESGGEVARVAAGRLRPTPLLGEHGRISDAVRLPNGELLLLERRLTWRGFRNALLAVSKRGDGYATGRRIRLPLGPLDNAEALAAEPLGGGALRLWLMTDDNFQPPFRTLLVALDLPPNARIGG